MGSKTNMVTVLVLLLLVLWLLVLGLLVLVLLVLEISEPRHKGALLTLVEIDEMHGQPPNGMNAKITVQAKS